MMKIISVRERTEEDKEDLHYIDNSCGDSIAKKYNYAIDLVLREGYEGWICFIHDDAVIETPQDVIDYQLRRAYSRKQRIAGVIGTYNLDYTMHWWYPDRQVNCVGYIKQKVLGPDGKPVVPTKVYEMKDWPGYHEGLATIDGVCMFIHTDLLKVQRFDEQFKGYHFYDVDYCLQALRRGVGICTVPVTVVHDSAGKLPYNINELRIPVFRKWADLVNTFPVNKFTKFAPEGYNPDEA